MWKCEWTKLFEHRETFLPVSCTVRSRLESGHDRIWYSTWRCSHPVSPWVTLCPCFSHHLQLLMGPSLCSHPFPLLQPFPLIPLLLLHAPFCSSSPGVFLGYSVTGPARGSSRISQEGGADRVFLSLPGLSHRFPVPVCTAALLCHVLWPPQRQREASAAGHRDIEPLQRPHLPDSTIGYFWLIPRFMIGHKTFSSVCLPCSRSTMASLFWASS